MLPCVFATVLLAVTFLAGPDCHHVSPGVSGAVQARARRRRPAQPSAASAQGGRRANGLSAAVEKVDIFTGIRPTPPIRERSERPQLLVVDLSCRWLRFQARRRNSQPQLWLRGTADRCVRRLRRTDPSSCHRPCTRLRVEYPREPSRHVRATTWQLSPPTPWRCRRAEQASLLRRAITRDGNNALVLSVARVRGSRPWWGAERFCGCPMCR